MSIPGYIEKLLLKYFGHLTVIPAQILYKVYPQKYTIEPQYTNQPDITYQLDKKGTTCVQEIVGSILYCSRAIEYPMLPALNKLLREQAKPTSKTLIKLDSLLHYTATFPDTLLCIKSSNTIIYVGSDTVYMVLPNSKKVE